MGSSSSTTTTTTTTSSFSYILSTPLHLIIHHIITTLFLSYTLFTSPTLSNTILIHSRIVPNFTVSFLQSIDNAGAFLASPNDSFQARITKSRPESKSFYFVIVHSSTNTIIWSANRNHPISQSSQLRLTSDGLALYNDTGHLIWLTPRGISISSMQLLESGNLILLDANNNSRWESFDFPTNVLVMGQKLHVRKSLVSSTSYEDISEGTYRLVVGESDAMLQWNGMSYWKLSKDPDAFRDTYFPVDYMVMNSSGVYLVGANGKQIVLRMILNGSNDVSAESLDFRIMTIDPNGMLSVVRINAMNAGNKEEMRSPHDSCRVPQICRSLGFCSSGGVCGCSPGFQYDTDTGNGSCVPKDSSLALPGPCSGSPSSSSVIKYLNLSDDLDYFSNSLVDPVMHDVDLSICQYLCSMNCSCLAIFHSQNSGSCYMINDYLSSMLIKSNSMRDTDRLGYIKTVEVQNGSKKNNTNFPILAVVLPLSLGVTMIALFTTLFWLGRRRKQRLGKKVKKLRPIHGNFSFAEGDVLFDLILGLPSKFEYEELEVATEGFRTKIGSGGFGTVYKGINLGDQTEVAIKKIDCLGAQGKREFLTEIATIGKIHHVNLIKLKGFCVHLGQRFLIYEYMKRGSLDRALFGGLPILEWKERYRIALGTARGLAYLHTGCEHKIIHCDVKPENILLDNGPQVKVCDFGLSKLLTREQSGFFTTMRGTRGYLAPEWLTNTAISDKTDVYSYGMVLLEIISGRKNFFIQVESNNSSRNSSHSSEEYENRMVVNFPLCALQMHREKRYLELVDPRLMGRVSRDEVKKLVRVALCCIHREPNLRPSMSNVVRMLEGGMPLNEPRIESLGFLRFYGPGALVENNEQIELVMHTQERSSINRTYNSPSYISSQQVSGPR